MAASLALPGAGFHLAAQQAPATESKDKMFSGTVTAVSANSLSATRTGSKEVKTFLLDSETRFEGPSPQVNSRVTIRYVSAEDGEHAIRVIVRGAAAPAPKK